jgi:hypothetical protein
MGLQLYSRYENKIPLKYHKRVLFYTKWTHGRMHGRTENIYSIFRDKLLLLGEHGYRMGGSEIKRQSA